MSDFTTAPANTLIVGMTRSGKSTAAIKFLLNSNPACRFLFDESSRWSRRLRLRPAYTAAECEAALVTRWVCFNPLRMFPDNYAAAFDWFCNWTFNCATRGPGEKILAIDELWLWVNNRVMPRNFRLCTQAGSEYGLRILALTQEPHNVNSSVVGQTTELICFRLQEPKAWDCVKALGADVERVKNLPLGSFISYNRLSGGSLAGRVF